MTSTIQAKLEAMLRAEIKSLSDGIFIIRDLNDKKDALITELKAEIEFLKEGREWLKGARNGLAREREGHIALINELLGALKSGDFVSGDLEIQTALEKAKEMGFE